MSGFTSSVPAPPYVSGEYFHPECIGIAAAGAAGVSGTIRLTPGFIRAPVTIAALVSRITTLAAGGNMQYALYAADPVTNKPTGAPLFTSGSLSTAASGLNETGAALTLKRGVYWFGVQADASGAAAVLTGISPTSTGFTSLIGQPAASNLVQGGANIIGYIKAGVYATWPQLTGNAATDGLTAVTASGCALWAFKVA
jgi:hypothetical protein